MFTKLINTIKDAIWPYLIIVLFINTMIGFIGHITSLFAVITGG